MVGEEVVVIGADALGHQLAVEEVVAGGLAGFGGGVGGGLVEVAQHGGDLAGLVGPANQLPVAIVGEGDGGGTPSRLAEPVFLCPGVVPGGGAVVAGEHVAVVVVGVALAAVPVA